MAQAPRAIAAVLLISDDPAALASFYRDTFSFDLRRYDLPQLQSHWACEIGKVYFSIWPRSAADSNRDANTNAAKGGVAFCVDNIVEEFSRLTQKGVEVEFAPKKTVIGTIARLRDPEGNIVELYQTLQR